MNKKFVAAIVALLAIVFALEYSMPRRFSWTPTFAHDDAQPFGCQLFDSVMTRSMPCGYRVVRQTLWQMQRDSTLASKPHGLLIFTTDYSYGVDNPKTLYQMAEQGWMILVACNYELFGLSDTLGLDGHYNSRFNIDAMTRVKLPPDTITWNGDRHFAACVHDEMTNNVITIDDTVHVQPLIDIKGNNHFLSPITDNEDQTNSTPHVAVSVKVGKGEITLVSAPLFMTNYGMLDQGIQPFVARLMNRMKHLPVVRTEAYMSATAQTESSPFYVLLKRPPLRLALYLTVGTIVLFMVFTARRRQRVIPVMRAPRNTTLDFVKLIGTLHYEQGDTRGLIEKKLTYTADKVRQATGIDITDDSHATQSADQLSRLTGIPADELRFTMANIKEALTGRHVVDQHEMRAHIESMDRILDRL